MAIDLQADMDDIILQAGFEEDIVYTPSGGTAKTISAVVHRDGTTQTVPSRRTGQSQNKTITRRYDISIEISTNATNGIADIIINEDSVALKRKVNDSTNENFLVRGIIMQDAGAYWLGLG